MKSVTRYQLPETRRENRNLFLFFNLVTGYWLLVTSLTGCAPTYPKANFAESIVRVCKHEYKVDVKADSKLTSLVDLKGMRLGAPDACHRFHHWPWRRFNGGRSDALRRGRFSAETLQGAAIARQRTESAEHR